MGRQYEDVMRELIDAVVGGEYAEGAWMPNESDLRTRFGASRGVMRESLRAMEERGLVMAHSGRGRTIRQREDWDTRSPEVLRACIARGPDPTILAQTIDARTVIERGAAAHATRSAADADFSLLAAYTDRVERALEPDAERTFGAGDPIVVAEAGFHHALALLSDNPMLAKLVEPLHLPLAELRRARAPERDPTVLLHHRRIVEGLSSRDPHMAQEAVAAYAQQLRRWLRARR
jgi:DNA-binding FadR family transcriptional regulator